MLTIKTKNGIEVIPQTKREREFMRLLRELLETFFPDQYEEYENGNS